jgi:hypothetical protein
MAVPEHRVPVGVHAVEPLDAADAELLPTLLAPGPLKPELLAPMLLPLLDSGLPPSESANPLPPLDAGPLVLDPAALAPPLVPASPTADGTSVNPASCVHAAATTVSSESARMCFIVRTRLESTESRRPAPRRARGQARHSQASPARAPWQKREWLRLRRGLRLR